MDINGFRRHGSASNPGSDSIGDARVGVAQRLIEGGQRLPQAQQTQDRLVSAGIPADRILLVGRDLTTPRTGSAGPSTVTAAARGALPGLIVGALVGWLLRLTDLVEPGPALGWTVLAAAVLGAVLGAIIGVLGHGLTASRRAAERDCVVRAGHFDLLVDADLADQAARLLREQTGDSESAGTSRHR